MGREQLSMKWLLFDRGGAEAAVAIWDEFEKTRRDWENVRDEDEERAEQELNWGRGNMEKDEERDENEGADGGREVNGEWELAIRGWNE